MAEDGERLIDWKKQRIPGLIGLAGALLVAFNNTVLGFLLIVAALLYGAYNSDAAMRDKPGVY